LKGYILAWDMSYAREDALENEISIDIAFSWVYNIPHKSTLL